MLQEISPMLLHLRLRRRMRISPEEEDASMSYSFSGPMYYLNKSYEEVLDDYTNCMRSKQHQPGTHELISMIF